MTEARITITENRQRTLGEKISNFLGMTPDTRNNRVILASGSINNEVGGKDNSWYRIDAEGRSGGNVAIHFYHDPQDQDGDVKVKGKLFLTGKNGGYVELASSTVIDGEIVIFKLGDTKKTEIKVAHGANPRYNGTSSAFYNLPRITLKR